MEHSNKTQYRTHFMHRKCRHRKHPKNIETSVRENGLGRISLRVAVTKAFQPAIHSQERYCLIQLMKRSMKNVIVVVQTIPEGPSRSCQR